MNGLDYLIFTGLLVIALFIDAAVVKIQEKRSKK